MKLAKLFVFLLCIVHVSEAQDIFNKAKGFLAAKDTAGAVATFQDALKAGQKTADCNYYLGAIAFNQGKLDDAIRYLSSAVSINDEHVDALIALGDAGLPRATLPTPLRNTSVLQRLPRKIVACPSLSVEHSWS